MQLPFIKRAGTDPDALAYFSRAGIASGTQTPSAYDNAASFNGTNQGLGINSNASLQIGGTSFSCAFWINPTLATVGGIVGKTSAGGITMEWEVSVNSGGTLQFYISNGSSFGTPLQLAITANRWSFVYVGYETGFLYGSVNNSALTTLSTSIIPQTETNPFWIGARGFAANSPSSSYYPGQLASVGFWKKALTASEVTALWNNGAGRTYASLDSGLLTNLISWWALNQNSVTADSHGTNTLTNNGSVTAPNIGPIITGYSDSRRLISDFVRGIKSLGLWNSMVCWPLRGSQNAGSGTTAFSLGGLGQFNGALVNAPGWGANGMIFASASGTRIDISNNAIFAPQNTTWGAMCVSSQTSGTRADVFGKTGSVEALADLSWGMRENNTTATLFITDGATFGGFSVSSTGLNLFRSLVMSYDNTLITGRVNGGTASTFSYTPNAQQNTSQVLRIGAGTLASATNFNGPVAFALFGYFSASQQVALHSLYRQTLGLGLGLP